MARPKRFSALRNWLNGEGAGEDQGGQDQGGQEGGEDQGGDDQGGQDGGEDQGGQDQGGNQGNQGGGNQRPAADANHPQFAHGVNAERRRWAQVLSSDPAATRTEAATALLIDDFPAERIIGMLPRMPQDQNTAALELLSRTPQHNLRGNANADGAEKDAGAASRKRAIARHNRTVPGGVKSRQGPRTRKAAQGQEE